MRRMTSIVALGLAVIALVSDASRRILHGEGNPESHQLPKR